MGSKYVKHRKAYTLITILSILVIVYVVLIISHKIEKDRIANRSGITLDMGSDGDTYKEYNVDGMTDEEINEYLKTIKSKEDSTDE